MVAILLGAVASSGIVGVDVRAHENAEFGVEIPVERVAPGADLPILGAEWASNADLDVRLDVGGVTVELGRVRTDENGHFATTVELPETLPPGIAAIQVVSDYGVLATATVTVDPAAPPAPSGAATGQHAARTSLPDFEVGPIVALLAAAGSLFLLLFRTRRSAGDRAPAARRGV